MRILLSGPCGVGKTAIGSLLAQSESGTVHLDFDELRTASDGISIRPGCSIRDLDLEECIGDLVRESGPSIVLDVGGDTVFRHAPVDNSERLAQLVDFKQRHDFAVVVIEASRDVVQERFLGCKSRRPDEFDDTWSSWTEVARACWYEAADKIVDTSHLTVGVASDERELIGRVLGTSAQA